MTYNLRRWMLVAAVGAPVLALILHQPVIAGLIVAAELAAGGLMARSWWARYRSGGRMAARRRRQHQGWASGRELARARRAAARLTRRICPGAGLLELGRSRRQPVAVSREKSALYSGPPGAGKTAALACHAADAPGLLFCTSTATDILLHSLPYRPGRVFVLNADRYGGIPSTLAWSPVEGCEDPVTAERRAGDMMAASPRDPSGRDAWHEDRGAQLIASMLHAAALVGGSMRDVYAWVLDPLNRVPMVILETRGEPGWASDLAALITDAGDSLPHVISSAKPALRWMRDPVMKTAACPPPGHPFSMAAFARSGDSVYLIGEKRPHGSLAPYYAAFGAELFEQLKQYAEECGGRPPAAATLVLDEMPLTCPMRLHDMLAQSRKYMITIIAAIQTLAQLHAKFGPDDGDTIRSACPVEVHYGGEKRIEHLDAVSEVAGDYDTWQGDMGTVMPEPLLHPGALRMLKPGSAVIFMPQCRPVLATLPAIWKRPGHRIAAADHPALRPAPARRPALDSRQRDAVALVLLYLGLHRQLRKPLRAIEAPRPMLTPASRDAGMYAVNGKAL